MGISIDWEGQSEVMPQRLEMWAIERPEAEFFYYGEEDKSLTFKEFNALANQIANNLIANGIQKSDRVCLLLTNTFITTIAMFGIWKAGAVYAPINFNYATRQVAFQIGDTKPKFLISDVNFIPLLNEIVEKIKELTIFMYRPAPGQHDYKEAADAARADFETIDFNSLLTGSQENPGVELNFYDICSIIYTSGTTGLPKGVVHPYRFLNNYIYSRRRLLTKDDVMYTDLPMYHIAASFHDIGCACWIGCKIAVWDKFSLSDYWNRIRKSGASTTLLMDVMIPWLLNAPESPDDKRNSLHIVNSQPLLEVHRKLAERFGIDFITGGFGQTESGNGTSIVVDEDLEEGTPPDLQKGLSRDEIRQILARDGKCMVNGKDTDLKLCMGTPMDVYEVKIFDEHGVSVPRGQVGELVFRPRLEHWLMEEYFGRPEATAEAFKDCWFHTGDAVVQAENGRYYFVGRMGAVIRRRSEFISPFQIEEAADSLPNVAMSAAFPVPAEVGGEDEVALVVVPLNDATLDEADIQAKLEKILPPFMFPKYIVFKKELPRTATNKVEKYKLRDELIKEYGLKEKR